MSIADEETLDRTRKIKVCVVGAGRLGRAIANRVPNAFDLVVVSRRSDQFPRPNGQGKLIVTDDLREARGSSVVLIAVPSSQVVTAMTALRPYLPSGALVANMATEAATDDVAAVMPRCRVVGCKVLGQSGEIERGSPALVAVQYASPEDRKLLAAVFSDVGEVVAASEELATAVNSLVARRMVDAHAGLADELQRLGVGDHVVRAVLGNLAVGVLRSIANGDAGPYLRRVIEEFGAARGPGGGSDGA